MLHVYCDVGVFCLYCGFKGDVNMSENVASNGAMINAKGTVALC